MGKYKVALDREEWLELESIVQKGTHASQKVVNALILLNCDEGEFRDRRMRNEDVATVLKISLRKIDRVKRRFVEEGLDVALAGRQSERVYEKKADGDFEAHLVALSCGTPPEGFSRWSLRFLADHAVELQYIDRRTKTDWAHFLRDLAEDYAGPRKITLVMDNLNTHRPGSFYEPFSPAEASIFGTASSSSIPQSRAVGST